MEPIKEVRGIVAHAEGKGVFILHDIREENAGTR